MNEVATKAKEILTPIIENIGYEVVDVDYSKVYGDDTLTVFIYKKGGITLSDCEAVNNAVDTALDEADITDGKPYNFNVSSPGLDRPVVTADDYRRSLDTELELIFAKPIGKKKKVNGILTAYDEETVTITVKSVPTVFQKQNLTTVRPYIKF